VRLRQRTVIALWLALLVGCVALIIAHARVRTDMSMFLPTAATPQQEFLVDQLREGAVARLILIGLENDSTEALAEISKALADKLKHSDRFSYVANGDFSWTTADQDLLMRYRYLLSPAVDENRFTAASLHQALEQGLRRLMSSAGIMEKRLLPADPTAEFLQVLEQWQAPEGPRLEHGVWFSADARRALLVVETKAPGFDLERQQAVMDELHRAFASSKSGSAHLLLTGPAVFALAARDAISQDVWRLSLLSVVLVVTLLWFVYRSGWFLLLTVLPLVAGILAAVAVVSLVFGYVHGITLAFGMTLIGVAVDYPTYLFARVKSTASAEAAMKRIWPVLRLAVVTMAVGYFAMLFSSFPGLGQLGLFAVTGLVAAAATTRWLLPALMTRGMSSRAMLVMARRTEAWTEFPYRWRFVLLAGLIAAVVFLFIRHGQWWQDDLASLSPVPETSKRLDQELRTQLGAPDVRQLIIVNAATAQAALEQCEQVVTNLKILVSQAALKGFDPACRYLPSISRQRARQAALPQRKVLRRHLQQATDGLPFKSGIFTPFLHDVETARTQTPIELQDLRGTALGLRVKRLLFPHGNGWVAAILLRGVNDSTRLREMAADGGSNKIFYLDLEEESDSLVKSYRDQALLLWGFGIIAILVVLFAGLRSVRGVVQVAAPVAASVIMVCAILLALGKSLSLFHLVALLLVAGLGMGYGLFFNSPQADPEEGRRTTLSVLLCSATTISVFGVLALSRIPVLSAIGVTVAVGSALCLILAAAFRGRSSQR
jgi:predicted exporter